MRAIDKLLFDACQIGSATTVTKLITEDGADPNARDLHNNTPLIWATRWSNIGAAIALVHFGADVRLSNNEGITPRSYVIDASFTNLLERAYNNPRAPYIFWFVTASERLTDPPDSEETPPAPTLYNVFASWCERHGLVFDTPSPAPSPAAGAGLPMHEEEPADYSLLMYPAAATLLIAGLIFYHS